MGVLDGWVPVAAWLGALADGHDTGSEGSVSDQLALEGSAQGGIADAVFSPCRAWRYMLERRWGRGGAVMFVGLNPSTADEHVDDPTIRRCVGFARSWGYSRLLMGNLFAYRSTDPSGLAVAADPVGPENDAWLRRLAGEVQLVVAAWGAHPLAAERAVDVRGLLGDVGVACLGTTKAGAPRHPLYLSRATELQPWEHAA